MSTEPDPWDEEPPQRPAPPGAIRAAGIMWIVMGVIFCVSGCLNIVMSVALQVRQPNCPATGTEGCALCLSLGIGVGLFMAGKNLIRGKAKDVLTTSILSLLLGLLYAAIAVGSIIFIAGDAVLALIIGGVSILIALGCFVPALLALSGRSQYRAWRRARRTRRRYEDGSDGDDDADERPWDRGRRGSG